MKLSTYLLATLKETPHDAELVSHQLMLRAGLIRRLSSGLYTWLPMGLRVLHKVEAIIRQELNKAGAHELLMPCVQPAELWQESERWDEFGPQLLKMKDRHQRDFCFGPTHEEVITSLIRNEINSYKALPLNLYQLQTKFRDEIRPRFGVMRSREFIMKDAYSFHASTESLDETYQVMYDAYSQIFTRLGLEFRAVLADTGAIGGSGSHEFQVLADSGEDQIFYSNQSQYAANLEKATYLTPEISQPNPSTLKELQTVDTPNVKTIDALCEFLACDQENTVKTLMVKGEDSPVVALILRGCDTLNPLLAEKHPLVKAPLTFVDEEEVLSTVGAHFGSLGPVNLELPIIVDYSARLLENFSCGANVDDQHFLNANWQRDCGPHDCTHLREVKVGDLSPDGQGLLQSCRGIEVGHIFKLGTKYAKAMNATVLNEQGKATYLEMGCYGIGVSRIVAACIEQHHDEHGILWPESMAPFQVIITPMNFHKSEKVRVESLKLYSTLQEHNIEVILDDRNERAGVLFKDAELIGIPKQIIIGERGLNNGIVEYKERRNGGEKQEVPLNEIQTILTA